MYKSRVRVYNKFCHASQELMATLIVISSVIVEEIPNIYRHIECQSSIIQLFYREIKVNNKIISR